MKVREAVALLSVVVMLLAACSGTPLNTPASGVAKQARSSTSPLPATIPESTAPSSAVSVAVPAHFDPKSLISTDRSLHFDFDEFVFTEQYRPLIERHGRYLASRAALAVKIEGNADERGSSEYDLALGQKRAEAVMHSLTVLGVNRSQMEGSSWGKEAPRATGHDEAAWAQNRRADLVYPR